MILVDGVWVEVQYTMAGEFKEDESGHLLVSLFIRVGKKGYEKV
jgi:hypothetical protein